MLTGPARERSPRGDSPRYSRGHGTTLAMVALGTAIYGLMGLWYRRENARRARAPLSDKHRRMSDEELEELGDDSPRYVYTT